ncbi:MAG: hypothetical protein KAX46_12330 [Chromatiaceae bacterium]|nr:hypothetical protein [Chromatiaceae bacterium]
MQEYRVNRECVQWLMRVVGLGGRVSGPNACERYPQHQVYPYLQRRAAVIDGYSRRLLSRGLSNTLDAGFCVDCLQDALGVPGQADLFNTDHGSQFPSDSFTVVLFGRRDRHQQGQTRPGAGQHLRRAPMAYRQG